MKVNTPSDIEAINTLAKVEPPTRGKLLSEYKGLSPNERKQLIENLVESAMVLGITDIYAIRDWIGNKRHPMNSISSAKSRVLERWKSETENVHENISKDRAMLISASWKEVQACERMYDECENVSEKVKVKTLKREWLQFISKLSFVDKAIEANEAPLNIVIHDSDVNMIEGES
jgi:membrane peptidoglycan carboxypeptidase